MSNFYEGQVVRYWQKSGGWRFGHFVRVIESRRGKDGLKKPDRCVIQHGDTSEEVPIAEVRPWPSEAAVV